MEQPTAWQYIVIVLLILIWLPAFTVIYFETYTSLIDKYKHRASTVKHKHCAPGQTPVAENTQHSDTDKPHNNYSGSTGGR